MAIITTIAIEIRNKILEIPLGIKNDSYLIVYLKTGNISSIKKALQGIFSCRDLTNVNIVTH
jgi:hypothetical protein